jgi:hypothetical protein
MKSKRVDSLDHLIQEIIVDAYGDIEQLWAFRQAFEDQVAVPCDAFVIGEAVTVLKFDFDGNERRGLTARCRRPGGSNYTVAAADVVLPEAAPGARHLAAYRKWMGLGALPKPRAVPPTAKAPAVDPNLPVDLVVLSVKQKTASCRLLGGDRPVSLRAGTVWDLVPGEILHLRPTRHWTYAGHPYLSGQILSRQIDAAALGLAPLRLEERGMWNPAEEYWGEEGEPIERWARPIITRGPRPAFEMEQVLPGFDPDDPESDPIGQSVDRRESGDTAGARAILMDVCQSDLRCLDAHAHLGNLKFEQLPEEAIRHFEVGVLIGELSLGENFDGLLQWGWIDNRLFLRCLHGYGLCLWRLRRFQEAYAVFDRMLWLNPSDNTGVRFLLADVRARRAWEDRTAD